MGTPRFQAVMNDSDEVIWTIERDPALRTTITAIALLDRSPDMARLEERLRSGARLIPRLHQRVVEPPFRLGPPRWVSVGEPDLGYHLRHVVAPPPATLRTVLDMAATLAMAGFDRSRPLWEFTVVDGLADGRAALIQKVHHSFTDGVGGIRLAMMLLDVSRDADAAAAGEVDGDLTAESVSPMGLAIDGLAGRAREALAFARATARISSGAARRVVTDPPGAARDAVRTATSIAKILAPATARQSPVFRGVSLQWRFDSIELPLATLRAAGKQAGGTVNDAFLAAVTAGLRRYHLRHGAPVDGLRVDMPISYRVGDDDLGGNRFVPARFTVPVGTPLDPIERMRTLGALARSWRNEPALPLTDTLAGLLNRLPPIVTTSVFASMLKGVDFVATNVPGAPFPVYLAGAEVVAEYAFAPPSGAAVNVSLISHVGTACIGVLSDRVAVPDGELFLECLREGFDEVVAVVPTKPVRTRPHRPKPAAATPANGKVGAAS
ncbi:MAG TPA: wax ester/triacylglycerol synthase domain-containing protein [Acidimicrobiales bacterium]|nr:wax ester/triacylglycerol synthase domain-containing protein [Acidimicrobiales bacterium]